MRGAKMMYAVEFYEDQNGESEVWEFLESLREQSMGNKDARIQYKQIILQIQLLEVIGTRQSPDNVKHIVGDIWEIRPGRNRVFFVHVEEGKFVLLHHYRKKTQKTPKREIIKAKAERDDYVQRMRGDKK